MNSWTRIPLKTSLILLVPLSLAHADDPLNSCDVHVLHKPIPGIIENETTHLLEKLYNERIAETEKLHHLQSQFQVMNSRIAHSPYGRSDIGQKKLEDAATAMSEKVKESENQVSALTEKIKPIEAELPLYHPKGRKFPLLQASEESSGAHGVVVEKLSDLNYRVEVYSTENSLYRGSTDLTLKVKPTGLLEISGDLWWIHDHSTGAEFAGPHGMAVYNDVMKRLVEEFKPKAISIKFTPTDEVYFIRSMMKRMAGASVETSAFDRLLDSGANFAPSHWESTSEQEALAKIAALSEETRSALYQEALGDTPTFRALGEAGFKPVHGRENISLITHTSHQGKTTYSLSLGRGIAGLH